MKIDPSKQEHMVKKAYVEERKLDRAYQQELFIEQELTVVSDVVQTEQDDVFATFKNSILTTYLKTTKAEKSSLQASVPFISDEFNEKFRLVPGQLVTVAAYTGRGKSTTTVNVAAKFIREGKRAFIISNEESAKDMFDMVACLLEGVDHTAMSNWVIPDSMRKRIHQRVVQLIDDKLLFVIDSDLSKSGTTKAEYILELIKAWDKAAVKPDVVIIDYLTNIYSAGSNSSDNHYFQLERFLTSLKNILNTVAFPIIMCAQMHSDDKKKGTALDQKLIMGGAIQRYSTVVIEVKTDINSGFSDYVLHKNRRFKKMGTLTLKYDMGLMRTPKLEDNGYASKIDELQKLGSTTEEETLSDIGVPNGF